MIVGCADGRDEGRCVCLVGREEGWLVGLCEGGEDGVNVGESVGETVGGTRTCVGAADGEVLGLAVGDCDGAESGTTSFRI